MLLIEASSPGSLLFWRRMSPANDNMRLTADSEIMCHFQTDLPPVLFIFFVPLEQRRQGELILHCVNMM